MSNIKAIEYATKIADALNGKFPVMNTWDEFFDVDRRGVKFIRVIKSSAQSGPRSVHLFVDAEGNAYKAAGWKAPAKGVRYNVSEPSRLLTMIQAADKFGGYLYR